MSVSVSFHSHVQNLTRPSVRKAVSTFRGKHTKQDAEMKKGMQEFVRSSPASRKEIYDVETKKVENLHEELENTKAEAETLAEKIEKDTAQLRADEKTLMEQHAQIKVKHDEHAKKTSKLESPGAVIKDDLFDCANAESFTDVQKKFTIYTPEDVDKKVTDKAFGYIILSAIDSSGVDMHAEGEPKTDLHAAKNWTTEKVSAEIKRVLKVTQKRKYEGGVLEDSSENDSPDVKKRKTGDGTSAGTPASGAGSSV